MDADALLARSDLDAEVAGRTILSGYSERIRGGGFGALDLASGTELRASLRTAQISTEAFYAKLAGKDELDAGEARHRLCERLNEAVPGGEFHHRRAGGGSLGRIRVFILAKSDPPVAIEAKRVLRSARSWACRGGHIGPGRPMTGMTTCPRCFWTLAGAGSADQRGGDR